MMHHTKTSALADVFCVAGGELPQSPTATTLSVCSRWSQPAPPKGELFGIFRSARIKLPLRGKTSPGRGKSFLSGGAFGSPRKVPGFAKGSPFGRAGASAPERARMLTRHFYVLHKPCLLSMTKCQKTFLNQNLENKDATKIHLNRRRIP